MAPRKCCCNVGCDIASDDFNRADSTSVGSDWDEESGDWAIASNKLTVPTAGVIRNVAVNPYGSNSMYISAKIENLADDTKYRILLQMNATGTEYYFAEWHYVDASNMYFSLGDESGVFETLGPDSPLIEGSQINASMTAKNQLCMSDLSSRITVCVEPKPASTHKYGGLAAGNSNGAAFDDYAAFATTAESVDCQSCDCTCDGWCVPDALVATFQEVNECPDLDGLTIDLDNVSPIKFGAGWSQLATFNCPDASGQFTLEFTCSDELKGSLNVTDSPLGPLGALNADADVSTCRPLSLRFGPYSLGSVSGCGTTVCCGGNPCGTSGADQSLFYIWITKRLTDYDY
jgi:hypothetical protein